MLSRRAVGVGDLHAKDVVKALIDLGLLFFIVIVPIYIVSRDINFYPICWGN